MVTVARLESGICKDPMFAPASVHLVFFVLSASETGLLLVVKLGRNVVLMHAAIKIMHENDQSNYRIKKITFICNKLQLILPFCLYVSASWQLFCDIFYAFFLLYNSLFHLQFAVPLSLSRRLPLRKLMTNCTKFSSFCGLKFSKVALVFHCTFAFHQPVYKIPKFSLVNDDRHIIWLM